MTALSVFLPAPAALPAILGGGITAALLVILLRLLVEVLVHLRLLVRGADVFRPDVVWILRERPHVRRGGERLHQHFGVLDRQLIHQVILRRAAEALDDMLLLAVQPRV